MRSPTAAEIYTNNHNNNNNSSNANSGSILGYLSHQLVIKDQNNNDITTAYKSNNNNPDHHTSFRSSLPSDIDYQTPIQANHLHKLSVNKNIPFQNNNTGMKLDKGQHSKVSISDLKDPTIVEDSDHNETGDGQELS